MLEVFNPCSNISVTLFIENIKSSDTLLVHRKCIISSICKAIMLIYFVSGCILAPSVDQQRPSQFMAGASREPVTFSTNIKKPIRAVAGMHL